jgi:hypothetical protein
MQNRIVEQTLYVGWPIAGLGWNWFFCRVDVGVLIGWSGGA